MAPLFSSIEGSYRSLEGTAGESISELTSSRDLKAMVDASLLLSVGERRGRHYIASDDLADVHRRIRAGRPPREEHDPFVAARDRLQLTLD